MTTPRCVELDENILLIVNDNLLVVVGDDGGDRAVIVLGDSLALDARLQLTRDNIIHKLGNIGLGDGLGLVEGELLVLGDMLDSESGPLASLKVEIAGVGAKGLCVDGSEVDDTSVLLRDRLEGLCEFSALLG